MQSPGDRRPRGIRLGVFLALALALSLLESSLLPPLGVPGAKWGLANIVTLVLLLNYSLPDAFLVSVFRVVIVSVFTGTFLGPGFWLAFSGAVISLSLMWILLSKSPLGLLGISIAGAVGHNFGQLAAYSIIIGSASTFYLLPALILASLLTGSLTGIAAERLRKY